MEELEIRPGEILASKYRVEKVLGVGGMGIVVAARHVTLGNLVAIKLMQPRAIAVKGAVERFMREGQAAAQLHSKHAAKVSDVGLLDSGAPFMVMEHLSGGDLAAIVEKQGAIAVADAAEYLLQACDAIGEAHAKGIVHRDLKPANLFLQTEPDGAPLIKVLDFGIAKMAGSEQGLTGTSQGMGSGGYMSPEQMSSAKMVDHRADIWALGVTLYELITAHRPFEADSLEQFVMRVIWEQPTPLATHRPDLPRELDAIILRCLEKKPEGRFSSVAHFALAIAPYAPPRAHVYVGRIAKQLGVDAPNLAQTQPGMAALSPGTAPLPTAFGPAPAVAMAAPHGYPPPAPAAGPVQHAPVAQPSGPYAAPPQAGPHPLAASQSGPYAAQPQTGPYPLAANQSGPYAVPSQTGPHPLAGSRPGGTAAVSGPYPAVDGRVSAPAGLAMGASSPGFGPGGQTDMTGGFRAAPAARKPPVALFALGGVLLIALGGGGVWLAMRPDAPLAESTPAAPLSAPLTAAAVPPTVTPAEPAKVDAPASAGTATTPPPSSAEPAAPGASASTKPLTGAKPAAATKASASAKPAVTTAAATATSKPVVSIPGGRN